LKKPNTKTPVWALIAGIILGLAATVAFFSIFIQIIPFGKDHTNPPVVSEPNWDSPETRALAKRSCFDCHSNETNWPIYSNIAPLSWLIMVDVTSAREVMNFSDWTPIPGLDTKEIGEVVLSGEMPPAPYLLLHPGARLTPEEAQRLAEGLAKSLEP